MYANDFATAAQRGSQALAMAESVGDECAMARALNALAYMRLWTNPDEARAGLARGIDIGAKVGDNWAVVFGLKVITVSWLMQENHDEMRRSAEDLREVAERLDSKFFLAWSHCLLSCVAVHRGELEDARAALATSLAYNEEIGDPACSGVATVLLAEAQLLAGEYDAAQTRLQDFLSRMAATGNVMAVPFAEILLATIIVARGDAAGGCRILEPLVERMRKLRLSLYLSWALSILGAALLTSGKHQAAENALQEANEVGRSLGNGWLVALADYHLGQLARQHGDLRRAENLHHEALARRVRGALHPGIAESLEALATLAAEQENYPDATRLLSAATALRQKLGIARWPSDQTNYEELLTRARDILNKSAFQTAWTEGEALPVVPVVA
jgi:ATP/maltotriose-dependent transcriptional regulator MalT